MSNNFDELNEALDNMGDIMSHIFNKRVNRRDKVKVDSSEICRMNIAWWDLRRALHRDLYNDRVYMKMLEEIKERDEEIVRWKGLYGSERGNNIPHELEIIELRKQLKEKDEKIAQLKCENSYKDETITELESDVKKYVGLWKMHRQKNENLRVHLKETVGQLDAMTHESGCWEGYYKRLKKDLDQATQPNKRPKNIEVFPHIYVRTRDCSDLVKGMGNFPREDLKREELLRLDWLSNLIKQMEDDDE